MILKWIGAIILWFLSFTFLTLGFIVVKSEERKQDTIFGIKLRDIEASADSIFVWVVFLVVNSLRRY